MWTVLILLVFVTASSALGNGYKDVIKEREHMLEKDLGMMLGNDITLNDAEEEANDIIMKMKRKELEYDFENPEHFNYSKHFFEYKDEIKKSDLYKIIQQMPKGAVLHAHDTGLLSPDYVLKLTYLDNLHVCFETENIRFLFSDKSPGTTCGTKWQLMETARSTSKNITEFDANLRKHFTLVINNPREVYTDINTVWSKFQRYFIITGSLFCYKPVWEKYFYDTLKAFKDDNVMYLEIRSVLPHLYDLDGIDYDEIETAHAYKRVTEKFVKDYPDFYGVKLIYAPLRSVDASTVKEYIKTAYELKRLLPDFLAGFDLVGQEDLGTPTKEFLNVLSKTEGKLNFFFHAGETNWYGTSSDENLADVIALGAKRIGHGFAIVKHPYLIEEIKKREIALEVNVISNAVLKLIDDLRNHPLAIYLANNLPVVLSCDDPGLWEADPLSHDFYVTFVGVASKRADLKVLKKLALNSLYYSTYPNKDKIVHEFDIRWAKFIHNIINNHSI